MASFTVLAIALGVSIGLVISVATEGLRDTGALPKYWRTSPERGPSARGARARRMAD